MYLLALAADFDGTIARNGVVDAIVAPIADRVEALGTFAALSGSTLPKHLPDPLTEEGACPAPGSAIAPIVICPETPRRDHRRHAGKNAAGGVGTQRSFHFRGHEKQSNGPARTLYRYRKIGDPVDELTCVRHLESGGSARWCRHVITNDGLARDSEAPRRDVTVAPSSPVVASARPYPAAMLLLSSHEGAWQFVRSKHNNGGRDDCQGHHER